MNRALFIKLFKIDLYNHFSTRPKSGCAYWTRLSRLQRALDRKGLYIFKREWQLQTKRTQTRSEPCSRGKAFGNRSVVSRHAAFIVTSSTACPNPARSRSVRLELRRSCMTAVTALWNYCRSAAQAQLPTRWILPETRVHASTWGANSCNPRSQAVEACASEGEKCV